MGHADHFLSRLDRVSHAHVELALSLYNDAGLVRAVLMESGVGERATRVAIALEDGDRGPYLLVTRDGHFVTCLGEGMSPGECPVIARARLDTIARRVTTLRAKLDAAASAMSDSEQARALSAHIYTAGPALSREDFLTLKAWQPLMAPHWVIQFYRTAQILEPNWEYIPSAYKNGEKVDKALRRLWYSIWALGHLVTLICLDPLPLWAKATDQTRHFVESFVPTCTRFHLAGVCYRAFWAAGKLGKGLLPPYKSFFESSVRPNDIFESLGPLLSIGARHRTARAEIRKALGGRHSVEDGRTAERLTFLPNDERDEMMTALRRYVASQRAFSDRVFDEPEACERVLLDAGRGRAVHWGKDADEGSPYRYPDKQSVPDEIARSIMLTAWWNISNDVRARDFGYLMAPWLARAAPEDLYLPRDYLRGVHGVGVGTDEIRGFFDDERKSRISTRTARNRVQVGRNEPCPCASGKKYKKCCGAAKGS